MMITGAEGLLGTELVNQLQSTCHCIPTTHKSMDITDKDKVYRMIHSCLPDIVIHCAGYTAVDKAEIDRETCYLVNVEGTRNIATECESIGCEFLYISTDYVFSGTGDTPYETGDVVEPVNYYGVTKREGERLALSCCTKSYVVRTSWLYGVHGRCFASTMLSKAHMSQVNVVDDQVGSPTYAPHLASAVAQLLQTHRYGIFHITGEGFCSWADFARQIFEEIGSQTKVVPVKSTDYPVVAKRPANSRLSKKCMDGIGVSRLPNWEDGLREYLRQINRII